jgi:hypothetical protein
MSLSQLSSPGSEASTPEPGAARSFSSLPLPPAPMAAPGEVQSVLDFSFTRFNKPVPATLVIWSSHRNAV